MIALVTGGGGFLGGAIVRKLLWRGDKVRSYARGDYPELRALGVDTYSGDLVDPVALARAAEGVDLIFHVAAKAGIWGRGEDFVASNVIGTMNVLDACGAAGVRRLVYTSSPSVIYNGKDLEGVDESIPYSSPYRADYPGTKAWAERMVLEANSPKLSTISLRPHLIWGPGDNHLIPRIIAKARAGGLRRIGHRPNLVDSTYIDDAADAHLLAADRLGPNSPVSGRAYFLSQGEPWPLWDLVNGILKAAHLPPVTRTIPPWLAMAVGSTLELVQTLRRSPDEPAMTRFLAHQLSTAHWFNIEAARRDLGYNPKVSIEEGLRRLEESWFGPIPR